MNFFEAIRTQAMAATVKPSHEAKLRRIFRWYSKNFSVPLPDVDGIPLEDILQAYYEDLYDGMSDRDREEEQASLAMTDSERLAKIMAEEADEAEMYEIGRALAAQEELDQARAKSRVKIADTKHPSLGPITARATPEAALPGAVSSTLPPNISMTFLDEDDFEAALEGHGTMAQPKKP